MTTKVLTINMCLAVSGLQNRILPKLCFLGGFLFGPPLFISLMYFSFNYLKYKQETTKLIGGLFLDSPYDPLTTTIALCVFLFAPLAILFGFAMGVQGGRILGAINTLVTGKHDHKRDRIADTVAAMADYDVVLIQEIYSGAPYFLDPNYPAVLMNAAKEAEFGHVAMSDNNVFPSVCMGTGLMILSKHPIVDFETLSFKNQYFAESFGVNRGALWARVKPPNSPPIDVFTLHTTASVREALLKGAPEFVLAAGDTARLGQFREIREFVEERRESKTSACVVAGDFNANIKWTKGKPDRGYAIDAVEETMVKGLGFEDCGWEVSYGYSPMDKILTNPNHPEGTAVTEDLIFVDPNTTDVVEYKQVPLLANKAGRAKGYTHLSDHQALSVEVQAKEGGRGRGKGVKSRSKSRSKSRGRSKSEQSKSATRRRSTRK